jgi:hypothetical protein
MFLSILVLAVVKGPVCPSFLAIAVLKIVFPHAFIPSTVDMDVNTLPICFIVDPVSFINISIYMDESSFPVSSVVFPHPLVVSTIRPDLPA